MTCISIFAHMCNFFVGVVPNVALFCHYFIPHLDGDSVSGSITWIPSSTKEIYPEGNLHLKWNEGRANWCWIKEENFLDLCKPWKKLEHGEDWSHFDAHDEELAAHEDALATKLCEKDEEIQALLAQQSQELEQKHKEAIESQAVNHASKIQEAGNAVEGAEGAKTKLEGKVKKLEEEIAFNNKEVLAVKADREKTTHTLVELQT